MCVKSLSPDRVQRHLKPVLMAQGIALKQVADDLEQLELLLALRHALVWTIRPTKSGCDIVVAGPIHYSGVNYGLLLRDLAQEVLPRTNMLIYKAGRNMCQPLRERDVLVVRSGKHLKEQQIRI